MKERIKAIAGYSAGAICIALWGYGVWHTEDSWLSLSEWVFPPVGIVRGALLLLGIV